MQAAIALCDAATRPSAAASTRWRGADACTRRPMSATSSTSCTAATSYRMAVCQTAPGRYLVEADGRADRGGGRGARAHEQRLRFGGRSHRTMTALQDRDLLVEVDGVPHRDLARRGRARAQPGAGRRGGGHRCAGDEVRAGDVVAVTESMKMEISLTAPVDGRVREVLVVRERPRRRRPPAAPDRAARDDPRRPSRRSASSPRRRPPTASSAWAGSCSATTCPTPTSRASSTASLAALLDCARARAARAVRRRARANRPHPDPGREAEIMGSPQEQLHAFLRCSIRR